MRPRRLTAFALVAAASSSLAAERGPQTESIPQRPTITEKNWRTHPRIAAIRTLVEANEAALKAGRLRRTEKRVCDSGRVVADRTSFRDAAGRTLKYVEAQGTDDSTYRIEHHYDDRGRLRFAYATSGAANGAKVRYRLYFAEDGRLIWRDRQEEGPGYTWLDDFPEAWLVRDPVRAFEAPRPEWCPWAPRDRDAAERAAGWCWLTIRGAVKDRSQNGGGDGRGGHPGEGAQRALGNVAGTDRLQAM